MEPKKKLMILFFLLLGIGTAIFLYAVSDVLTPFLISILLAYIFLPGVKILTGRGIPSTAAILLIFLSLTGLFLFLAFFIFPKLFGELNRFAEAVPFYSSRLEIWIGRLQDDYSRFALPASFRAAADEGIASLQEALVQAVKSLTEGIIRLLTYLWMMIIVPVMTFYFLKDADAISKKIVSVLPPGSRSEIILLWSKINEVLRRFIRGHLSVACIVGTLNGIGFALVGLDYAVTLGFVAGILDIIPYFGPIIGVIPAVFLAVLQSPLMVWKVVLVMLIVQQLENSLISPKIIGDSVGLHPLLIIFVLLAGGSLFGIWGMLFAIPLTAVLKVILKFIFQKAVADRTH